MKNAVTVWVSSLRRKSTLRSSAIQFPNAWIRMLASTRRCFANRFPYGLIFQSKDNALRIVALAHLQQQPGYWKNRL